MKILRMQYLSLGIMLFFARIETTYAGNSSPLLWKKCSYLGDYRQGAYYISLEWYSGGNRPKVKVFARRDPEEDFKDVTSEVTCNEEAGRCIDYRFVGGDNYYYIQQDLPGTAGTRSEIALVTVPTTVDHWGPEPPRIVWAQKQHDKNGGTTVLIKWKTVGSAIIEKYDFPIYNIYRRVVQAAKTTGEYKLLASISGSDSHRSSPNEFEYVDTSVESLSQEYEYVITGLTASFHESPQSNSMRVHMADQ